MDPHGYPYYEGQHLRTMSPKPFEHYSYHHPYPNFYLPPPYHYYTPPTYPYSNPYTIYNPLPNTISYVHEKDESLSYIAENINNQLYHVMREIDLKCELPTKPINLPKNDPLPHNKPLPMHIVLTNQNSRTR